MNMESEAKQSEPMPEDLNRLVVLFQAGRHAELESQARQLLEQHPDNGFAWKALGLSLQAQGKDALPVLQKAADLAPYDAQAHFNLGGYLQALGQFEGAAASYRQAVSIKPDYAEAHNNLGNVLKALGRLEEASASYRKAAEAWPDHAMMHNNLGIVLKDLGELEAARASFKRALQLNPDYAEAHNNLGIVQQELGEIDEAEASYRRALELNPGYVEAHANLGLALYNLLRFEEAADSSRRALELRPDYAPAWNNLGLALNLLGQTNEAEASYRRALELNPGYVKAHANLGLMFNEIGHPEAAKSHFEAAITLAPELCEAHIGLAFHLLAQGKYRRGWQEYEWRHQCVTGKSYAEDPCHPGSLLPRPSSYMPVPFVGKRFFMISAQGIGDELSFLRFAAEIRRRGGWVAYSASPKLRPLLMRSPELDCVVASGDCIEDTDYTLLITEAPLILGMQDNDPIPQPFPLVPRSDRVAQLSQRLAGLGPGPYIGVTWRAGTPPIALAGNIKVSFRTAPITSLAAALRPWPGQILVLQRNPKAQEMAAFSQALGREVHDFSAANDDLEEMLALLSLIHDYVGVSNTNMQLSASLSRPCRILLPKLRDWRWMVGAQASPWFQGFRVYQQDHDGLWDGALAQLKRDLLDIK